MMISKQEIDTFTMIENIHCNCRWNTDDADIYYYTVFQKNNKFYLIIVDEDKNPIEINDDGDFYIREVEKSDKSDYMNVGEIIVSNWKFVR